MGKVFGLVLIIVAIGARLSGEPASRTTSGVIATVACAIYGLVLLFSESNKPTKEPSAERVPQLSSTPPSSESVRKMALCRRCGLEIAPDYVACPHCGAPLKIKCPSCGKWLDLQYIVCPYCATGLNARQGTDAK